MDGPQAGGELLRPEWLFEVANRVQGLAAPMTGSGDPPGLEDLFAIFPPESDFEQRVKEALLARMKGEQPRWLPCERGHRIAAPAYRELTPSPERLDAAVAKAKWLLQSDPASHWTVEVLARRARCNRTDLEIGFRRRYSLTVRKFLIVCRVEAAKALLRQTAWRLEEIAKGVGYRSKTSLFEHFRWVLHMTPDTYRHGWTLVGANDVVHGLLSRLDSERVPRGAMSRSV